MIEKLNPTDQRPTLMINKINEIIELLNDAWPDGLEVLTQQEESKGEE